MGSSRSSGRSLAASRPDRLIGCEVPRVFTPPLRRLTPKTTLGFALIEFAEVVLGIPLLPWQKWLAIHALELLPDGSFRFRTVILLVARQNGKSTFLQILALFFLYVRGCKLVIGTAQNLDIAEEVWQGAVDIASDIPDLAGEIDDIVRTNGKKALELAHGERYKVQAANRRGGRGLSGDLVMLDELREHRTWDAWGAVTKTTMARALALIWGVSNAGDATSVVLRRLRLIAHLALDDPDGLAELDDTSLVSLDDDDELGPDDESLGIFEWSAPPGCALNDRDAWTQANPSLGYTITERAIRSALTTDPEAVFRTEVLCQWVDRMAPPKIDVETWSEGEDDESAMVGRVVFAYEVTPDRSSATIGAAGLRADGRTHVEVIDTRDGTAWLPGRLAALAKRWKPAAVLCRSGSPAVAVKEKIEAKGVKVRALSKQDFASACGALYDGVTDGSVVHGVEPELEDALAGAATTKVGDAWAWSLSLSTSNVAPLIAVTLANWPQARTADVAANVH